MFELYKIQFFHFLIFSFKIAQLNGTKLRTKMMIVKRKFRFVQIELILLGEMLKW